MKRDKADKYENVYEKYYVTTRTRITDPESSVHLKLSISAFKNVQIRVDGSDPSIKNINCKASIPMLMRRNVDIEASSR